MKLILVSALSMIMGTALGFAQKDDRPGHGGAGDDVDREMTFMERLIEHDDARSVIGLTEEQVNALSGKLEKVKLSRDRLMLERQGLAIEQARLLTQQDVDEDRVLALVGELGRVQTELARVRMKAMLDVKRILTVEQLRRLREQGRMRMKERLSPGGRDNGKGGGSEHREQRGRPPFRWKRSAGEAR